MLSDDAVVGLACLAFPEQCRTRGRRVLVTLEVRDHALIIGGAEYLVVNLDDGGKEKLDPSAIVGKEGSYYQWPIPSGCVVVRYTDGWQHESGIVVYAPSEDIKVPSAAVPAGIRFRVDRR